MGAYLEWFDGRERRMLLLEGDRLTVGSAPDNDVVIDDTSVSRVHAVVQQLNGRWFIEDCGSRNGTTVNERRLIGMVALTSNDDATLGHARLTFRGHVSRSGRLTELVVSENAIELHLTNLADKFKIDAGVVTIADLRDQHG